jgi:hypothetical protein
VDSNHRPPDPQSGALNQLSYSCPAVPIGKTRNLEEKIFLGKDAIPTGKAEIAQDITSNTKARADARAYLANVAF